MSQTKRQPSKNAASKPKDAVAGRAAVAPKIVYRDQMQMDTHCFKGEVAIATRFDQYSVPNLRQIEHVHFFHSKNSMGADMTHTNQVNGHLHEVKWEVDAEGNLIAKCGPPLKKVTKQLKNGSTKSSMVPVYFTGDEGEKMLDNHSHRMTYTGSSRLTQQKIEEIRKNNQAVIGAPKSIVDKSTADKMPEGYDVAETTTTAVE